jgi:hypothetical protein
MFSSFWLPVIALAHEHTFIGVNEATFKETERPQPWYDYQENLAVLYSINPDKYGRDFDINLYFDSVSQRLSPPSEKPLDMQNVYVINFIGDCGLCYEVDVELNGEEAANLKTERSKHTPTVVGIAFVEVFKAHRGQRICTLITALAFNFQKKCGETLGRGHAVWLKNESMSVYENEDDINADWKKSIDSRLHASDDIWLQHLHKWAAGTVAYLRAFKVAGFEKVFVKNVHGARKRGVNECLREIDDMFKLCSNGDDLDGCYDAINQIKEAYSNTRLRGGNYEEDSGSEDDYLEDDQVNDELGLSTHARRKRRRPEEPNPERTVKFLKTS